MMDEGLEHLVDHREVVAVLAELSLEVDEIGVHEVQAPGKQLRELEGGIRLRPQERERMLDHGSARKRVAVCGMPVERW
jgi:hypothetical protein